MIFGDLQHMIAFAGVAAVLDMGTVGVGGVGGVGGVVGVPAVGDAVVADHDEAHWAAYFGWDCRWQAVA